MLRKIGAFCLCFFVFLAPMASANSPWGANYFPNTELITQDGKKVKFFDDLIKDKIVAINFIYTTCPDVCPLETAQLTRVQNIMGDRVGKDIHFYSISIDPEIDTPEVLKDYRERFGAKWTFLTGDKNEIINLRRKLGLYIDGVGKGKNKNNHNVSMIVGNQTTGRWMKRSPFENPHVLADQLGNWLTGWKAPQKGKDYASAPELRPLTRGEPLFRTRCSSCHTVDGNHHVNAIGPDLVGVTKRRDKQWLVNWLRAPDKMIADKDPIALAMLKQYNNLAMPNLRLNQQEVMDLIAYMDQLNVPFDVAQNNNSSDVVAVMNAWIREPHPDANTNAGYMTLVNAGDQTVKLMSATSALYDSVEFHEMAMVDGLMEMQSLNQLELAPGGQLKFVPAGKHLMLRNPKQSLTQGDQVDIVLTFESGLTQTIALTVQPN